MPISPQTVTTFLHDVEHLAAQEDFSLIRDLIDEHAFFRFNDGDVIGRPAIQAAFEKTWRGDPSVKKSRFCLSDITVLTVDTCSATATTTWDWEGPQGGQVFAVRGRGTRVLVKTGDSFCIVHEYLSRFPPVAWGLGGNMATPH